MAHLPPARPRSRPLRARARPRSLGGGGEKRAVGTEMSGRRVRAGKRSARSEPCGQGSAARTRSWIWIWGTGSLRRRSSGGLRWEDGWAWSLSGEVVGGIPHRGRRRSEENAGKASIRHPSHCPRGRNPFQESAGSGPRMVSWPGHR